MASKAKKEHGSYIYIYIGMGMGTGSMHKLLPSSTGAILSSLPNIPDRERCRPAPLLNTNKRQAIPVRMPNRWNATIFIACNHCLFRCAKLTFPSKFRHFNFLIQDPTACHLSIFTHSIDILILSSLTMEYPMHRSRYSHVLNVVAVTNIAVAES